ncbi:MAG: HAMP domain-containing histidine kinase [Leptolyngbyaceae cyanobacterium SM1_1_3]|nr:HAMP domain-containing histidine kinase [Leptolyngbyaceae cyanobacterium SM1_1_3]NJN04533.1 HAMP domain-containing histidine kinase [Leptolyngbyaceae cyanobacterium RM1_1_2]
MIPSHSSQSSAVEALQPLQIAYERALEIAHFKAGFLARTAHELRSPLSHIISLNQLILNDLCDDPDEERELVGQAYQGALKMLQLLDQLIQVSKLEIGRVEPQIEILPVDLLFAQVQLQVQLQVRDRGMQLHIAELPSNLQVVADRRWLTQVWVSLVESAVEAAQRGTIQLGAEQAGAKQVCIWLQDGRSPADWSELIESWQNPSDPTHSSPTETLSMGLRLLIAHSTVAAMGGQLEIQPVALADIEPGFRMACLLPLA